MAEQTYGDWIRSNSPLPTKKYKKEHMTQVTDHIVDANKMVTAVEWLIWELIDSGLFEGNVMPNSMLFKNAKQIEKEQIMGAYKHGQKNEFSHVMVGKILITGEEYYEQTFTTQAQ